MAHCRQRSPTLSPAPLWEQDLTIVIRSYMVRRNTIYLVYSECRIHLHVLLEERKKFDHITPVLRRLHWLPIQCRIEYKVAILTLKIRETGQPSFLSHAVEPKEVTRNLQACDDNSIAYDLRSMKSDFARLAFSFVVPTVLNKLPSDLR